MKIPDWTHFLVMIRIRIIYNFPGLPVWPGDFVMSFSGTQEGFACILLEENTKGWDDETNYLCWKTGTTNPDIQFDQLG